ncbi:hypothetical protein F1880_003237 [Penicillium rolfsii]|nr:hypothetical protein F1880_003237 [Penicillium rolfsii]
MDALITSGYNGWWTFVNYGPLTTTFTPAPSCTGSEAISLGYISDDQVSIIAHAQCTKNLALGDSCFPAVTTTQTTFSAPPSSAHWEGIGGYYSPGLYCPQGWETIGIAGRNAANSLSSSGVLSTTPVVTVSSSGISTKASPMPTDVYPAVVLKGILEPEQTMALCCPSDIKQMYAFLQGRIYTYNLTFISSFTADMIGEGCFSVDPTYKPSGACYRHVWLRGEETISYTSGTQVITSVSDSIETETVTLADVQASKYTGMVYVYMLTLLHKKSDLVSAESAAKATGSEGTAAATATSNAAVSLGGMKREGSNGIVGVIGVVMAAMGLGAAILWQ